ncbi:MAG: alpha/beta hydrolase [Acidimicrobiaceae bacterium]|nr:alpha/beta hydrolase [Acidimicrobiaceae bacterium]
MPFADLDSVRLFYTDEGSGDRPLLFVHGYTCDSHDWSWQLAHFAQTHRVIAVDLRGHGRSSAPDTGYAPQDLAADVASLIQGLAGVDRVVALGHSLGGVVVSALAVEHPELVEGLVAVDPGYLIPDELAATFVDPLLEGLRAPDPVPAAQGLLGALNGPSQPAALVTWQQRRVAGVPAHVLRQVMEALLPGLAAEANSVPYLERRTCPVLSFYTEPARAARDLGLCSDKRSRTVVWEGSGHWLHQERWQDFNSLVESWLATL